MTVNSFPSVAIVSGLALGETGRIDLADGEPDVFIGGLPIDTSADVSVGVSGGEVSVYDGGTALTKDGKIVFIDLKDEALPGNARYTDGLPHTNNGTLYVSSTQPIANYAHGIPMTSTGAVAVETITPPNTRIRTTSGDLLVTSAGDYIIAGGNSNG